MLKHLPLFFILFMVVFSCSNQQDETKTPFDNASSKHETLPDGFRQAKLFQPLEEAIKSNAKTTTTGDTTKYQLDKTKQDSGRYLGVNVVSAIYTVKDNVLTEITLILDEGHTESVFSELTQKFGNPEKQCKKKITYDNGKEYTGSDVRWTSGKYSLKIAQSDANKFPVVSILSTEKMKELDLKKSNSSIKDMEVDCSKFAPPK